MAPKMPSSTKPETPQRNRSAPAAESPGDFLVVGIGASAGGLEACTKLVQSLPARTGMAFVLVQHLDPDHDSMMADLLSNHTSMAVSQATDGQPLEPDHFYVIPPGVYLSIADGVLRLSEPQARHGARLPFDFLLHSLAEDRGAGAVCVVLSGTGADGSRGLKAVKEKGGLVIAQDPDETAHDGMPRNAIMTGAVDLVLAAAEIPDAIVGYDRRNERTRASAELRPRKGEKDWLPEIVDLVRAEVGHDFSLYKDGTLRRRIERRRALASIESRDMAAYVQLIRSDKRELDILVKDLLINVTNFFRDPAAFDLLAETVVPDLVRNHPQNHPIRIWVAGCSTGEEAYSFAMLFREEMAKAKRNLKLQVFASDVDEDAVVAAREGFYPPAIETDVSADRLARFFSKEDRGYRVLPELRGAVVFTVQDVLADPPFSRLDLMSCRNLLIYFSSEAQTKLVSLFHFALRENGVLVLGRSESAGDVDGRFEAISKAERLYRRIGRSRPGEFGFATSEGVRAPAASKRRPAPTRQAAIADLCRRLIMETYAPAGVLIDAKHQQLYSLGPIDRYLHVPPGYPSQDVLAMAPPKLRARLRSAIEQARGGDARVVVPGGRIDRDGRSIPFSVAVQPVRSEAEPLMLVCFVEETERESADARTQGRREPAESGRRGADLERELEATRLDLQAAIRDLEISTEEQKTINEEALSISEEYQSTNEELLTSKEELQSLNEELTALNSQLQETLERQRTTSNDLQNVLYSTDVATLFLDMDLRIRFFTPATKSLFRVIPSDVGRPLADLNSLAADGALLTDARTVLRNSDPLEREIEAQSGAWYVRRILPYRAHDDGVEGVVVTFVDITERRRAADALEATKRQADLANAAKSRFLAAASHDLRQPLQTLTLLHGLLARLVESEKAKQLVERLEDTLGSMTGMLNALLDINQIDAGTVRASVSRFAIADLLDHLRTDFALQAEAEGIDFRFVSCGLFVESDRNLLEQIVRNLLSNALKYTTIGKVLLGCRRRPDGALSIEVWDTGIGVPEGELRAIFDEYHQVDNAARERSRGLGLGLSIVQRLCDLLGYRVRVSSQRGKGSVFAIEVTHPQGAAERRPEPARPIEAEAVDDGRTGDVLVVEDDPEVRGLLKLLLEDEGHRITTAQDGPAALRLLAQDAVRPDLLLADYNLPNGLNGLAVAAKIRETLRSPIPVVILTGDISTETLSAIARHDFAKLDKPVKPKALHLTIQRLLAAPRSAPNGQAPRTAEPAAAPGPQPALIFIVDDDIRLCEAMREVLEEDGKSVEAYSTSEAFLDAYRPGRGQCLVIDAYLPGMLGLDLLRRLRDGGDRLPAIMITGSSDVQMAVQAMKAGASDFIEKPVGRDDLLASIGRVIEQSHAAPRQPAWQEGAARQIAGLTVRQREIMEMVLAGHPSKNIAADLNISQRTVENHRASIMQKTGAESLPALARLAMAASWTADGEPA